MKNPLLNLSERRKSGIHSGIPSYCTANDLVIEAVLEQAKRFDSPVLIEGTANQINQFGGYTGMTPADFRDYVYKIAEKVNFEKDNIILGGDHMGPLVWADLKADEAMKNSRELVKLCVLAGFRKIHLDTSMKLADDPLNERLSDDVIAERGAILLKECENAYQELLKKNPASIRPVYIIGSEVPIPGGSQDDEEGLQITKPEDFERTLTAYKKKFDEYGISERWQDVIAVVVQPGVEFGDKDIHMYDRVKAEKLCSVLKKYPGFVFEGHSTDYQPKEKLRELVQDGVAILKVGPALTFALREGLFALSMIERELIPENQRACFIETLEAEMLENPKNWMKHYHGSEQEKYISRKYSYSDRCRYYLSSEKVKNSISKLFANINGVSEKITAGMLRQYMPLQYRRVRDGELSVSASALVKDCVKNVCEDYNYAVYGGSVSC